MRSAREVALQVVDAYWQALRAGGGTHEQRFVARVERLIQEDRAARLVTTPQKRRRRLRLIRRRPQSAA